MTIDELFEVAYGNKFDLNKMTLSDKESGIAFVARKGGLNGHSGVSGFVEPVAGVEPYPAGLLTVALGGSRLLSTYVQQRPFYTAQNVAVLRPRDPTMTLRARLFYAMCITRNAFRYTAFGREANRTLRTIELPGTVPDWVEASAVPTYEGLSATADAPMELTDVKTWGEFRLSELFSLSKGSRLTKADRTPGTTRFIGASELQNGITDMSDLEPLYPAGVLTVSYNGSVGQAFYQDEPFWPSDDIIVLTPKVPMTKWVQLFIAAVIRHERTRYTYGYKWTLGRMKNTTIRLPVKTGGMPDLDFMERFMKGLPFSASIARGDGALGTIGGEAQEAAGVAMTSNAKP